MTDINDVQYHLTIQKLLTSFTKDFPVLVEKTFTKLISLKNKHDLKASYLMSVIIKWKKRERSDEILRVIDKTALNNWNEFELLEEVELVVDLFFSWLLDYPKSLISLNHLVLILQNTKLNEQINNAICYPDSFSVSRRKLVLESTKFSLDTSEYQIVMIVADFFLFLYKSNEETSREMISESILAISSFLIGNKSMSDVENNIFEIELFSRIVKICILVKSFDEDLSVISDGTSLMAREKNKDLKSLDFPNSFNVSNIDDKEIGSKLAKKRNSDSTFKSLVSLLQPLKSSNYIRSKFGSEVTDYLSLFDGKSNSVLNDRKNSAIEIRGMIPLGRFEIPEAQSEQNEEIPKIDIVSSKQSGTTVGIFNTMTKITKLKQKTSSSSAAEKKTENENFSRRSRGFRTGKTRAVIELDDEESFEKEIEIVRHISEQ